MSKFSPTPAQREAIEARGCWVLVSAGAGSGKTKVLTERLLSRICDERDPVDLDSFLIITFTRAAAGELKGRIMQELAQRLAADPGNMRLRRQSALCSRAQIGTIHSFCARLLKEHSHVLGISPDFKIADEDRARELKDRALDQVLEERYAEPQAHPGFLELADTVGAGRSDQRLSRLVLDLHQRMQCHARPEDWAKAQVEQLKSPAPQAKDSPWGREILSQARDIAAFWAGQLDRLMEEMAGDQKIMAAYGSSIGESGDQLRELRRCLDMGWDEARACLPIDFPRLKALRSPEDPELAQRVKGRRESCKKAMEKLSELLYAPWDQLRQEMEEAAPAMEALLELTLDFDRRFSKEKSSRGLMDYGDLEHLAARLLILPDGSPSPTALELRGRYSEIMVDEYQDVSRVQDAIFQALASPGRGLFLVGDVKQSIYRFRLADPGIFTEKYLAWPEGGEARPGEPRKILLRENFRSRREVLEGANSVFSLCMSRRLGDLDYDQGARLICAASYPGPGPKPELLLLELETDQEDSPDKTAQEARLVARQIRDLILSGETVSTPQGPRPLDYGDIAILLRSANAVGPIYQRQLQALGIPVGTDKGSGFFDSSEISSLMSLLAVLDDPHQDIALIAVLSSPAFGFTADELSQIRGADKRCGLFAAMKKAAEGMEKCRDFLSLLDKLRSLAADLSVSELVWQLIDRLDLLAICAAMEDGESRRERLMEMLELAERFQAGGYRGLHRFVNWLERLKQRGEEPVSGAPGGSAVQILSIHKSKGLEFPVVFLCDAARRFNRQDSRDTVLVHPVLGLGPKRTDLERGVEYPTLARSAIRLRLEREMLSEELRLLYVAMTRARERLIVTAAMKDPEGAVEKARSRLSLPMDPELLSQAGSMADWLIWSALADGGEHLGLRICKAGEDAPIQPAPQAPAEEPEPVREEDLLALEEKLGYVYPHAQAKSLPSKVTATELKAGWEPDPEAGDLSPRASRPFSLPDFTRKDRPLTGAERGTATHLVLQYMELEKGRDSKGIEGEICRLEAQGFISPRQAQGVDRRALERFFTSPLGKRLLEAKELIREFKFSLLWPAEEVFPQAEGESLLLQGVVDCCIIEPEGLTILDYKTDRVKDLAQARERAQSYRGQILTYARAMERILGRPVKESLLYFLQPGIEISVK